MVGNQQKERQVESANIVSLNVEQSYSLENDLLLELDKTIFSDKYENMSNIAIIGILEILKLRLLNG